MDTHGFAARFTARLRTREKKKLNYLQLVEVLINSWAPATNLSCSGKSQKERKCEGNVLLERIEEQRKLT